MNPEHATQHEQSPVVSFYSGSSPDSEGRWIDEIWAWDDDRLEVVHDYIQWLFPLRTRSGFNPDAPILSDADIETFRGSDELRMRLLRSLQLMLRFYGLQLRRTPSNDPVVEKSERFPSRRANWLTPGNHNHLRLTRILTSVSLLGLRAEAAALQACLLDIAHEYPNAVTRQTLTFWERAVSA
jgi:hypothetical protein